MADLTPPLAALLAVPASFLLYRLLFSTGARQALAAYHRERLYGPPSSNESPRSHTRRRRGASQPSTLQPQPMYDVTIELEPNEKYWRVIDPVERTRGEETSYEDWPDEDKEAANAFIKHKDRSIETAEKDTTDTGDLEELSWDHVTPASDPDLLAKIATYFDGMYPDEPADVIRAKCRLLDVDAYVNAQMAAQAELRG